MLFIQFVLIFIFSYLALNVAYIFLFAIAGRFRRKIDYSPSVPKNKIAVMIPAYKDDSVIVETARSAASHDYPRDAFDVFILADQLRVDTLDKLSDLPVQVIVVRFEKSSKARSLKFGLEHISGHYDMICILDADNIMEAGCLEKANSAYNKGFKMIQMHRTAKNLNTATAVLDAMSEEINNHLFRQGHRALGISSALIGSGMAFDFAEFREVMLQTDIENNPGEDKELSIEMFKKGFVCEYIEDAKVFDEKVQSDEVLETQRTRWISSQVRYFYELWIKGMKETFSNGIHYFSFALQNAVLPRVMLLALVVFFFALSLVLYAWKRIELKPGLLWWSSLFVVYSLSLFISVYRRIPLKKIAWATVSLPTTFLSFFKALLKSKVDQEEFIRTPKEYSEEA